MGAATPWGRHQLRPLACWPAIWLTKAANASTLMLNCWQNGHSSGILPIGVACRLMVEGSLSEMLWDAGTTSRYPAAAVVQKWGSGTSLTLPITQWQGITSASQCRQWTGVVASTPCCKAPEHFITLLSLRTNCSIRLRAVPCKPSRDAANACMLDSKSGRLLHCSQSMFDWLFKSHQFTTAISWEQARCEHAISRLLLPLKELHQRRL